MKTTICLHYLSPPSLSTVSLYYTSLSYFCTDLRATLKTIPGRLVFLISAHSPSILCGRCAVFFLYPTSYSVEYEWVRSPSPSSSSTSLHFSRVVHGNLSCPGLLCCLDVQWEGLIRNEDSSINRTQFAALNTVEPL